MLYPGDAKLMTTMSRQPRRAHCQFRASSRTFTSRLSSASHCAIPRFSASAQLSRPWLAANGLMGPGH
jgi:hypothetical protein